MSKPSMAYSKNAEKLTDGRYKINKKQGNAN